METINLQSRVPIVMKDGRPTPEFLRAFLALVNRTGGPASDAESDLMNNSTFQALLGMVAQLYSRQPPENMPIITTNSLEDRIAKLEGYVSQLMARP